MDHNEQIEQLLEELYNETGMRFSIEDNQNDTPETLRRLTRLLHRYTGDQNKGFFFKELISGELGEDEMIRRGRRLRLKEDAPWLLLYISFRTSYDTEVISVLSSLYASAGDHMVEEDGEHLVVLRQLRSPISDSDLAAAARQVRDVIESELMMSVDVSYDSCCSDYKHLHETFHRAKAAMEIGRMFSSGSSIYGYHDMGLGKLIYTLPEEVCREFIADHMGDFDPRNIDSETKHTIEVFFDSGLSIAETARELFVHRNTLVYRLEKLEKQTGLDIRSFRDAVILEIALLMAQRDTTGH